MSVSYLVRYQGSASDPRAFVDYYAKQHAGILQRFPRIQELVLHTPLKCTDPFPTSPGGVALLAEMVFESSQDLDSALQSEARAAAREDYHNFPNFEGEVLHQAMRKERIF